MTTFNLRVDLDGGTNKEQAEERIDTLVGGHPKLNIHSHTNEEQETTVLDVDFAPENKSPSGGSTRGIMRGVR